MFRSHDTKTTLFLVIADYLVVEGDIYLLQSDLGVYRQVTGRTVRQNTDQDSRSSTGQAASFRSRGQTWGSKRHRRVPSNRQSVIKDASENDPENIDSLVPELSSPAPEPHKTSQRTSRQESAQGTMAVVEQEQKSRSPVELEEGFLPVTSYSVLPKVCVPTAFVNGSHSISCKTTET